MTRTFAVIGDPIDGSLSPTIHNAAFRKLEMDCTYIAYRIQKGELEEGIESLKKIQIAGFNVTIPHKVEVLKYLDKVDENASLIGAVNTVSNNDGILKGFNTDMDGFLDPIKKRDLEVEGKSILLIGAGGASIAIVAGFAKEHAKKIIIFNRTKENAEKLSDFAKSVRIESRVISQSEIGEVTADYIVNTAPYGKDNQPSPIPSSIINENSIVYDIVYMPMNTNLIKKAKEKKSIIIYGYEMLLGQAARSFEIWHGVKAPYESMKKAILGGF